MFAIQLEDNIADEVSVLQTLALDEESAVVLLQKHAREWISVQEPVPRSATLHSRTGPAVDIALGDAILATYTAFKINAIYSNHGMLLIAELNS